MDRIAAIILAAGLSRRMGAQNKLLMPIAGTPLIRRVVGTYLCAIDGPVTVVTGFAAEAVKAALDGLTAQFAQNDRFAEGQPSSVVAGLRHAPDADALLIGLGDQPLLTPQDLTDLIAAHAAGDSGKITIPRHSGQRGNPILIPRALRPRLTKNPDRPGCMRFTRDHPDHVQAAHLSAPGFYTDIDTPADYARLAPDSMEDAL